MIVSVNVNVFYDAVCVFLPLITELISSGAETEQRVLLLLGFYLHWDYTQQDTFEFSTKVLSLS